MFIVMYYFYNLFYLHISGPFPTDTWYLSPLVCLVFLGLIPVWVVVARLSPPIREVLRSGWQPVIIAMSISRYELEPSF